MNRRAAIEKIRTRLRGGEASIGSWIQIPNPSIAEIMAHAGYDWVAVDMEHGSIGHHQLPDLCRALELGGTLPLARLAQASEHECKHALDAGAGGIIVAMVESAEQLAAARDVCRWPPAGTRGVGFSRANLFGQHFDAYRDEAQRPLLVAMIEHVHGIENLEAIVSVEGLDAIMIGPYDLSASMGLTAEFTAPKFQEATAHVLAVCARHAMPCGMHVVMPDAEELARRVSEGYRFIAYSMDAVFLSAGAARPPL